jgi:carbon-monoxide dehydrogenase medium subunit
VKLVGARGERRLPLGEFFLAPNKTVMNAELLTEVHLPQAPQQGRGVFFKLGTRAAPEDIAIVSVAVFAVPDAARTSWQDIRIALGAVAPTPMRARHAEEALLGQPIKGNAMKDAARLAAEKDAQPISDIRGSANYRRAMVEVLVNRALQHVASEIAQEEAR